MACHSKTKIYIHLIWGTFNHGKIPAKSLRLLLFQHLMQQSKKLKITIYKMNVQPEHLHLLINLPANRTISEIAKNLKGESSFWINNNGFVSGKFRWQRGYGAYSVSASHLKRVEYYIIMQDKHHNRKSYAEEYEEWIKQYGLEEKDN